MPTEDSEDPPSRLVRAVADAATVLAGARLGGVGGAVIAAAATPYTEEFLKRALEEFRPDVQRRTTQMLEVAAKACEREANELAELISSSERTRLLTANAMAAAAGTAWPSKVYALGRALADGLLAADEAAINVADLAIPAMADMERPHVALLELLVRWKPDEASRWSSGMQEARQEYDDLWLGWQVGARSWTTQQIETVRPMLRPVLTSLLGTLQRHGLADQNDQTPRLLEHFSKELHRQTVRRGSGPEAPRSGDGTLLPPTISTATMNMLAPAPSWEPTELGERILEYYQLAAREFDIKQVR